MNVLQTHQLTIGYKRRIVAADLSVTLQAGELVCLLGANGAGKSTLMRTLAAMQPSLAGHIDLMGKPLQSYKPHELATQLSIVLTERPEANHLSGYEVVALGRYPYTNWSGRLSEQDEKIIQWAIESVGAKLLAARPVNEMSDGERQKIMIARALAQEPHLILLDEPTAFLDLPRRVEIMRTLRKLAHETACAILLSTHDLELALRSADKLWLLSAQGQIQVGAPEDLVLSGAFEAAFHSEGVEFDPQIGTFRVHHHQIGQIGLLGDGLRAIWTRRALERIGYEVIENDRILPCVEVVDEGWYLHLSEKQIHDSVASVIAALKIRENQATMGGV